MKMNGHLKTLQFRHANLEYKIANENKKPHPNELLLRNLKQQKLKLKDIILTYQSHCHTQL